MTFQLLLYLFHLAGPSFLLCTDMCCLPMRVEVSGTLNFKFRSNQSSQKIMPNEHQGPPLGNLPIHKVLRSLCVDLLPLVRSHHPALSRYPFFSTVRPLDFLIGAFKFAGNGWVLISYRHSCYRNTKVIAGDEGKVISKLNHTDAYLLVTACVQGKV